MFDTALHNLKSPENVGIIVRAHVAMGGRKLVVIGPEPWRFKKRSQAFSRKLEGICEIVSVPDDDSFFAWCERETVTPVAIEIATPPVFLHQFQFPPHPILVVGNEGQGLSPEFLWRCHGVVTIPQYGPVACLNSAVSCCIGMYEVVHRKSETATIKGHKYVATRQGQRTV